MDIPRKYNEKGQRICPICGYIMEEDDLHDYCQPCIRDIHEAELDEYDS